MIKKILNKLFSQKIDDEHLECAIDEDKVDCGHLDDDQDKAYVGVPAPILNPIDEWFSAHMDAHQQSLRSKKNIKSLMRSRKKQLSIIPKSLTTSIK